MGLGPEELAAVAAIFFLAGVVKGTIGLGLPMISIALLGVWLPVEQAAAILVFPAFLTNVWQSLVGGALKSLLMRLWPMLCFLVAGTVLTAGVITSGNSTLTGVFLGAILALYGGFALAGYQFAVSRQAEPVLGSAAGLTTGLICGMTGTFAVPAAPYIQALNLGKDELVQAIGIVALIATSALALGLGLNDGLEFGDAVPGSVGVLAAFVGMSIGQALRARVPADVFRRWILMGLIALGGVMIIRSL